MKQDSQRKTMIPKKSSQVAPQRTAKSAGVSFNASERMRMKPQRPTYEFGNDAIKPNFGTFGNPIRPPMDTQHSGDMLDNEHMASQMADSKPSQYSSFQAAPMETFRGEQMGGMVGSLGAEGQDSMSAGNLTHPTQSNVGSILGSLGQLAMPKGGNGFGQVGSIDPTSLVRVGPGQYLNPHTKQKVSGMKDAGMAAMHMGAQRQNRA